ncbi:hypothetical protein WG622_14750 [Cognatishimia sp. D5M38]|uniref:VCBS repeat-containing protein n=1 Tax=Cognatishimia coralii TaxID=3083254 RepID=A0ABU8QJC7_9RHOB
MRIPLLAAISLLSATLAWAEPVSEVSSDLDGDGSAEIFRLTGQEDGDADLVIDTDRWQLIIKDFVWHGAGFGQEASLALAPNGSVQVMSMNESIGRNRWRLTLTIAYRDQAYRVAGYTFTWYDTLDLENSGNCDVNLLSGKGLLALGDKDPEPIRVTWGAVKITDWTHVPVWEGPCEQR